MAFKDFKEYLNEKGKLVEKPTDQLDYEGKTPNKPDNWIADNKNGALPPKGQPEPYVAPHVKPKMPKQEKGLADDKRGEKFVDMPELEEKMKKLKEAKTTEEFHALTKDMSNKEFIALMAESHNYEISDEIPTVTAYAAGNYHPFPPQAIRYIVALAQKNQKILESLLYALRDTGLIKESMKCLMAMPDGYDNLAEVFDDDECGCDHCGKFVKSIAKRYDDYVDKYDMIEEEVAEPFGFEDEEIEKDKDEDDDEEIANNNDRQDDEEHDSNDENQPDDDFDMDEPDDSDNKEEDNEDDLNTDEDEEQEEPKPKNKRPKRTFAEDHLIKSMKAHDRLSKKMSI